jgi:CheY-like chemotaxis protein
MTPGPPLDRTPVLLVDDDPARRELLMTALVRCGAVVTSAATVAQALRRWDRARPCVLVCNFQLEGCTRLARRARLAGVPAIALTTEASVESPAVLDAGYGTHVVLPVPPRTFASIVGIVVNDDSERPRAG